MLSLLQPVVKWKRALLFRSYLVGTARKIGAVRMLLINSFFLHLEWRLDPGSEDYM